MRDQLQVVDHAPQRLETDAQGRTQTHAAVDHGGHHDSDLLSCRLCDACQF